MKVSFLIPGVGESVVDASEHDKLHRVCKLVSVTENIPGHFHVRLEGATDDLNLSSRIRDLPIHDGTRLLVMPTLHGGCAGGFNCCGLGAGCKLCAIM